MIFQVNISKMAEKGNFLDVDLVAKIGGKPGKQPKILGGENIVWITEGLPADIQENTIYKIKIKVDEPGLGEGVLFLKFDNFRMILNGATQVADLYVRYEFNSGTKTEWAPYPKNPIHIAEVCGASISLVVGHTQVGHLDVCNHTIDLTLTGGKTDVNSTGIPARVQGLQIRVLNEMVRAGEKIRFELNSEKEHNEAKVSLVDISGRAIDVASFQLHAGKTEFSPDAPQVPIGMYMLKVTTEDGQMASWKLLITR